MGLLCVLGLVFIDARAGGHVVLAEFRSNRVTRGCHGFWCHVDAIGPHVGDQASLIQPLGGVHCHPRTKPEFTAGFLLQSRRHEGGGRVAVGGFGFYRFDRQIARIHRLFRHFRLGRVFKVKFIELFASQNGKARINGLVARCAKLGFDRPVFAVVEGFDFHLTLNNDAQGDGLNAACGFRTGQATPENGAEFETHEVIKRTAREVGVDQRLIHDAGIFHRLGDGSFGDRVENNPRYGGVFLDDFAFAQRFFEVPTDRFAFAVRVGREDQIVVFHEGVGNRLEVLFRIARDLPKHVEIVVRVDRSVFGRQVANVSVGGQNRVVRSQIFVDCLGLSRGLNDNNRHGNPFKIRDANGRARCGGP